MRDIMLVYMRAGGWREHDFRPYVAHLNRSQGARPTAWFYDGFLFMAYGGAPSGHLYYNGPTDAADWRFFLDWCFGDGEALSALDAAVRDLEGGLGPVPQPRRVIVMIPYPYPGQRAFGDVDGDGTSEDFSRPAERLQTVQWFVDEVESRWRAARLPRLELWGYYWMHEAVGPADADLVRQVAQHVHGLGRGFMWIPYFNASGTRDWRRLGFDLAILQPNYAFMDRGGWRDETRLSVAANLARRWGMGIEIELDGRATESRDSLLNLLEYLRHGAPDLDDYGRALRAYYQGHHSISDLYESGLPACNAAYDALFNITRGRYPVVRRSLALGARCLADGTPTHRLTDGKWATRVGVVPAAPPWRPGDRHEVLVELSRPVTVSEVRLHLAPVRRRNLGRVLPRSVALRVPRQDVRSDAPQRLRAWSDLDVRWLPPGLRSDGLAGGFGRLLFPCRRTSRLLISVSQPRASLRLDEVQVLANLIPMQGAVCAAYPAPSSGTPDVLIDGDSETSASWNGGDLRLHLDLGEERVVGALEVRGCTGTLQVTSLAAGRDSQSDTSPVPFVAQRLQGALAVRVSPGPVRRFDLRLAWPEGESLRLDEIELPPARNVALGARYEYDPPYRAKYPDDGGELTDGHLSTGFADGGTVGYYATPATVTVDLGRPYDVERVRAHVQGGGYAAVHFPSHVTVSTSLDARTWRIAAHAMPPGRTSATSHQSMRFVVAQFPRTRARYVRVLCEARGWTMLSEIEVLAPHSEDKYADNTGLLTDGAYTETNYAQKRAAGWTDRERRVTLDLGRPRTIVRVNAHLQGGGPAAVWFPRKMSVATSDGVSQYCGGAMAAKRGTEPFSRQDAVYSTCGRLGEKGSVPFLAVHPYSAKTLPTSADGAEWRDAGSTTAHPPENGHEDVRGYMSVAFAARTARYVRLHF
ncbi:MAG: DUF4855 domain-containing protein, partial [Armatimonadota bacterium]